VAYLLGLTTNLPDGSQGSRGFFLGRREGFSIRCATCRDLFVRGNEKGWNGWEGNGKGYRVTSWGF
jgi:hypothetical protein